MKKRIITKESIYNFNQHLILEARSAATIEKYIRDVVTFSKYMNGKTVTKEDVIDYKKKLKEIVMQ